MDILLYTVPILQYHLFMIAILLQT